MTEEEKPESPTTKAPGPDEPTTETPVAPAPSGEGPAEEKADAAAKAEPGKAPKKKKKKAAATAEVVDDSTEGTSLKAAQTAFEIGDYKTARGLAQKLMSSTKPSIADAARNILRRTDVDPAQMIFLAVCACAVLGVAFYYLR